MRVNAKKRRRNRLEIGFGTLLGVLVAANGSSCETPPIDLGESCELTTDCRAPLVCRLGSCRQECRELRDCRAGLLCVRDAEGFGVCQEPDETECVLASECPAGLVCRFGMCTNECDVDRDCPAGALCATSAEGSACVDPSDTECQLNSDCVAPLICARDRRCRAQCVTSRDCRDGRVCDMAAMPRVCVPPGSIDGGMMDGSVPDGGMEMDGGASDGGGDGGTMAVAPPPPTFTAGGATACAVSGSQLRCFGANGFGQVGNGMASATPVATPTTVLTGTVRAFGSGPEHTCAVTDDLYCWGNNADRQLGVGSTNALETSPLPVTPALAGVVNLALGRSHTCAVTGTDLHCWGDNLEGQLCDGTTTDRSAPRRITLDGTPVQVVAGAYHTCVLLSDGRVRCCGRNDLGQLGTGDRAQHSAPTANLVTNAVRLASGNDHGCAVGRDGSLRCWGDNQQGQIGIGAAGGDRDPVAVSGVGVTREIAAGYLHTCSLSTAGDVYCWGSDSQGQAGVSPIPFPPRVPTPTRVSLTSTATEVRTGGSHTCASLSTGPAMCFGDNTSYQFGDTGAGGPIPRAVSW